MIQTTLYASVLAKIGVERGKLLSEAKLKTLTETKKLQEFTNQLRDTTYQEKLAKIPLPLTSRKLERAFNENLISTYEKLIKSSPKKAKEYLHLYLYRFEVENIKAIIKATNANLTPEQKINKTYLSVQDYLKNRVVIEEAAKALTLKQIANVMKNTDYSLALSMGLESYEEDGSTACIDVLLDKVFYEKLYETYESLAKNEKPHALFYSSMNNDSFTLLTLLRGKALAYDPNWLRLAVPQNNFNLDKETVESLVSTIDFDSALKIAQESYYSKYIVKAANSWEIIANSEKAFKKAVLEYAKTSIVNETFNIGAVLAFMTQKENEVHNLTIISFGVEANMEPTYIQNQLLL